MKQFFLPNLPGQIIYFVMSLITLILSVLGFNNQDLIDKKPYFLFMVFFSLIVMIMQITAIIVIVKNRKAIS
jgi:hypothetical protein